MWLENLNDVKDRRIQGAKKAAVTRVMKNKGDGVAETREIRCMCARPDHVHDMIKCNGDCNLWYHYGCAGLETDPISCDACDSCSLIDHTGEAVDEDGKYDCLCGRPNSFEVMIGCDGKTCPVGWFHFSCASVGEPPSGDWFCDRCISSKDQ